MTPKPPPRRYPLCGAVLLACLLTACAPKLGYTPDPSLTLVGNANRFLRIVEADYFRYGKDGSCSIDRVRDDGWIRVLCGRPDGTVRQYETWLR